MSLISLILILVLVGVILYLVETVVPMDPAIKSLIRIVVLLVVIIWIVRVFVGDVVIPVPHLR